jgi:cardiolipin synthase A/B
MKPHDRGQTTLRLPAWGSAVLCILLMCTSSCGQLEKGIAAPHARYADFALGAGIRPAQIIVEPDDGVRPLVKLIDRSQERILVEDYILTDSVIIHALERASVQGVRVYVMLEKDALGMGTQPTRVLGQLRAAGIDVRWARAGFYLTHAKVIVLDDRTAVVSTANFSRSAFSRNREILAVDQRRKDVTEISNIIRSDWDSRPARLSDRNLVVSPDNARQKLLALISSAREEIAIYAEEIADPKFEQALIRAANRGVRVRVILAHGATPASARLLAGAGVKVRELASPYEHAKMVSVDGRETFVGSENFSSASLDRNREVGVLLQGSSTRRLHTFFQIDWRHSQAVWAR